MAERHSPPPLGSRQIIRELATNPIAALSIGVNKTKNHLNAQAKQEDDYSKEDDPYRNMYEVIPWEFALSRATLDKVDNITPGLGPDSKPGSSYSASCEYLLDLLLRRAKPGSAD